MIGRTVSTVACSTAVSVPDAHLGAAIQHAGQDRITVVISDPGDVRKVAQDRRIDVVAI